MMKNKIISYILIAYLFIQPFLDVCAITQFSYINIIVRSSFLIFMFIYLFINNKYRPFLILLLFLGIVYFICFYTQNIDIISIISSIMKLYYLPITLFFFYYIRADLVKEKYLLIVLFLYLFLFLSSYVFKFGYNNYLEAVGKKGFRGVFNSINEISAIMIGLLPISLDYLKRNKKIIISVLLIISVFLVSLLAGTKVLMMGIIISLFFVYIKDVLSVYKSLSKSKKVFFIISLFIFLIIFFFMIRYTRFFTNMLVQAKFFKVDRIFSFEFIDKVLFNNRLTFLNYNFVYYRNSNILSYLFGIGYSNPLKFVEIDIFDILFRFGIIGLIIFIVPLIFIFRKVKFNFITLYSFIFLLFISLTSGHVLLNPNVLIYFGYFLIILKNNSKK